MANTPLNLWAQLAQLKTTCKWVELSHPLSPQTPHWSGFSPMEEETIFDFDTSIFFAQRFSLVSQYGTHVDAPCHFVQGAPSLDSIGAMDLVLPLCVLDVSPKCQENPDYILGLQDILDWEAAHGEIPAGSFVAFRSGWSKRADMDNMDAEGNKHYPGWGMDALHFLVEQRHIKAIGHETSDTDAPVSIAINGFQGEYYILEQGCYQIELLRNLEQLPPTGSLIVCGFPQVVGGAGFTARCFALAPKEEA